MIHRRHVVTAAVGVVTLLTVGAGWFAFGQKTNAPEQLTAGMEAPLVKDVNMGRDVATLEGQLEALTQRVDALETTVGKLVDELKGMKKKSNKPVTGQ